MLPVSRAVSTTAEIYRDLAKTENKTKKSDTKTSISVPSHDTHPRKLFLLQFNRIHGSDTAQQCCFNQAVVASFHYFFP